MAEHTLEEFTEFFEYLDELRESGETNMYGAGAYLKKDFGLNDGDSRDITLAWMRTFSDDPSPEVRARAALAKVKEKV